MAQGNGAAHPATMGAQFKNLMYNMGFNKQNPTNGPSNQQSPQRTGGNQQQNNQPDASQFKFDPMTGKPITNGASNNPETQVSPLDAYKGLWSAFEPKDGETVETAPNFDIDPKLIHGAAEGLSFSSNMPEDLDLSEFSEGQRNAMFKMLDHVGRMSYATSINHLPKLTQKWYDLRSKHDMKNIPNMVKDTMTFSGIENMDIAQKNPVVKENLKMVSKHLRAMYPDASPEWINGKAQDFFMQVAQAMNPDQFQQAEVRQQQEAVKPGGLDFDWGEWLDKSGKAA